MHALHVALFPVGISNVGQQIYHFVDGTIDLERETSCYENCYFPTAVAKGDSEGLPITGKDPGAAKLRALLKKPRGPRRRLRSWFDGKWSN
jgi:molybdopterin-synthase adenylyltransferase